MSTTTEILKMARECGLQFGLTDRKRLEMFYRHAFEEGQESIIRLQQTGRDPMDSRHSTEQPK